MGPQHLMLRAPVLGLVSSRAGIGVVALDSESLFAVRKRNVGPNAGFMAAEVRQNSETIVGNEGRKEHDLQSQKGVGDADNTDLNHDHDGANKDMTAGKISGRAGKDLEVDPVSALETWPRIGNMMPTWAGPRALPGAGLGAGLLDAVKATKDNVLSAAAAKGFPFLGGGGPAQATDDETGQNRGEVQEAARGAADGGGGGPEERPPADEVLRPASEVVAAASGIAPSRIAQEGAVEDSRVNAGEGGLRDDVREDELARVENSNSNWRTQMRVPETIRSVGEQGLAGAGGLLSAMNTVGGGLTTSLKQMVAGAVPGSASSRGPGGRDENVGDGADEATGQQNVMQTLGEAVIDSQKISQENDRELVRRVDSEKENLERMERELADVKVKAERANSGVSYLASTFKRTLSTLGLSGTSPSGKQPEGGDEEMEGAEDAARSSSQHTEDGSEQRPKDSMWDRAQLGRMASENARALSNAASSTLGRFIGSTSGSGTGVAADGDAAGNEAAQDEHEEGKMSLPAPAEGSSVHNPNPDRPGVFGIDIGGKVSGAVAASPSGDLAKKTAAGLHSVASKVFQGDSGGGPVDDSREISQEQGPEDISKQFPLVTQNEHEEQEFPLTQDEARPKEVGKSEDEKVKEQEGDGILEHDGDGEESKRIIDQANAGVAAASAAAMPEDEVERTERQRTGASGAEHDFHELPISDAEQLDLIPQDSTEAFQFAIKPDKQAEYCALPTPTPSECNIGGSAIFPHKSVDESSAKVLGADVDVFGVKSQDVKLEDKVQLCRLQCLMHSECVHWSLEQQDSPSWSCTLFKHDTETTLDYSCVQAEHYPNSALSGLPTAFAGCVPSAQMRGTLLAAGAQASSSGLLLVGKLQEKMNALLEKYQYVSDTDSEQIVDQKEKIATAIEYFLKRIVGDNDMTSGPFSVRQTQEIKAMEDGHVRAITGGPDKMLSAMAEISEKLQALDVGLQVQPEDEELVKQLKNMNEHIKLLASNLKPIARRAEAAISAAQTVAQQEQLVSPMKQ